MSEVTTVAKVKDLFEKIAELEHDQWISLMNYLISSNKITDPEYIKHVNSLTIPYCHLNEKQKDSDRVFAKAVIELLLSEGIIK